MGRISTSVGLISGLPIEDIVNQLIAVESRPRDLAEAQVANLTDRKTALLAISAQILTLQFSGSKLSDKSIIAARTATSSAPTLLSATVAAGAPLGSYQFVPVRQVQNQQYLSNGFSSADSLVGAGTVTVKLGGFLDRSAAFESLNGGLGVQRGSIRITDRSGASAVIDLKTARTIGDVLDAINGSDGVAVIASAVGDSLVLTDNTGLTASDLKVDEVGVGTTAADLGLLGSVASNTLTGNDIVYLSGALDLDFLNDGNGLRSRAGIDDFRIAKKDGTTVDVNVSTAETLQDVVDLINNDAENNGDLVASLSGDSIVLTDSFVSPVPLTVTAINGSNSAYDLGIVGSEQGGGVLTGTRIHAGLNTVLLNSLDGGFSTGIGDTQFTGGLLDLTGSGGSTTIDLSAAETLHDVISGINGAGVGLTAQLNAAGNGITITDAASGAITISDQTGNTAAFLGITAAAAASPVESGDRNLRYINEHTSLDRLNGGDGLRRGVITITDSSGAISDVDLTDTAITTVGDVIDRLNLSGIGVSARINDTGDGILLEDIAAGGGELIVADKDSTTAAELRLLGSDGLSGRIDGAYRYTVTFDGTDTLTTAVTKIANSGAPIAAGVLNDGGTVNPFSLFVSATRSGELGRVLIDPGATNLQLTKLVEGTDALLGLGTTLNGAPQKLVSSRSNAFFDVLPDLSIDILGTSTSPVTVSVTRDDAVVTDAVQEFVDNFNKTADAISDATSFNPDTSERAVLQADRTASALSRTLFDLGAHSFGNSGDSIRLLSDIGVKLKNGQLTFDSSVLQEKLANEPTAVEQFFDTANVGLAERLDTVLDAITDSIDGTIAQRATVLDEQITDLNERVDRLNLQLESRRQRLLQQFLLTEQILAQLQTQQDALSRIAPLPQVGSNSNNNNN